MPWKMVGMAWWTAAVSESDSHWHALLYNQSVLRDKLQPLVGLAVASSGVSVVIQEIISAASSMIYAFQQLCHTEDQQRRPSVVTSNKDNNNSACGDQQQAASMFDHAVTMQQQWHGHHQQNQHGGCGMTAAASSSTTAAEEIIIELDAAELLAKYTHYCQVSGKGFKRDANLRMHMRAHGDEYKSNAWRTRPRQAAAPGETQEFLGGGLTTRGRRRVAGGRGSTPSVQPLKSVMCAKNHYKRSHCPKMYGCNFSVLSDLRSHKKHCGDHRWLCTSFSRKDKLIALFAAPQQARHC